ncbi:hypothetical protein D6D15_04136 [Aureobasidium pullulans]|uniref:BTB domain-containing protein n=1 Tax=Aureobasidium pullulans TaxID=5580 RepID=A0A4S9BCX3_AURPU|nr:hypothetical protein D6D15_04136 [Aureobasidium pullulans]
MMLNAPSQIHPGPSDITLRLDNGEVIHAHKRILSQQSLVFKAAFLSGFADVAEYGIEDHEPETVYTMIKHIYGPHNDAEFQAKPSKELLKIYLIADEYQIISLSKRVTDIVWKRLDEKSVDDACVDLFEPIVRPYYVESRYDTCEDTGWFPRLLARRLGRSLGTEKAFQRSVRSCTVCLSNRHCDKCVQRWSASFSIDVLIAKVGTYRPVRIGTYKPAKTC